MNSHVSAQRSGVSSDSRTAQQRTRLLLACGIGASALYVAMNAAFPIMRDGYSSFSQTISELSAVGVPNRVLWSWLGIVYTALVAAFGWGVVQASRRNKNLRICGWLLFAYGLVGPLWSVAPMHTREVLAAGGGTWQDTMHLVMGAVSVTFMFASMAFGAAAFDKAFRAYTVVTILLMLAFGLLTALDAKDVQQNLPTPWLGVWERINVGVFMLWMMMLSVKLLNRKRFLATAKLKTV